jgi:hypothetical protein
MKKIIILLIILTAFAFTTRAQTFSAADFNNNLGKTGTLCDRVSSIKIYSDTLTLISMGGNHTNQKYVIAVKGNKITLDWANLKGKQMCVTGVFELRNGRPAIVAAQPNQIEFK